MITTVDNNGAPREQAIKQSRRYSSVGYAEFQPARQKERITKKSNSAKNYVIGIMVFAALQWGMGLVVKRMVYKQSFFYEEMNNVCCGPFWPLVGLQWLVFGPWISGCICLLCVIYPDPRTWPAYCKCWRFGKWLPLWIIEIYTVGVIVYWFVYLFYVPTNIRRRMQQSIERIHTKQDQFEAQWDDVQRYFQCCGMMSRYDWVNSTIPSKEIPFITGAQPRDPTCNVGTYGFHPRTDNGRTDSHQFATEFCIVWPMSCCNKEKEHCLALPDNVAVWGKHCLEAEVIYGCLIIAVVLVFAIIGHIITYIAYRRAKELEHLVLRSPPAQPEAHF